MPFQFPSHIDIYMVRDFVIIVVGIFYSIILHEMGHAVSAYFFGDNTAKEAGRISLNPVKHVDIIGTVVLPIGCLLMGLPVFGWAKPVPVNPSNFSKYRLGMVVVSLAGVTINFFLAILLFFLFVVTGLESLLQVAAVNIMLLSFNIIPLPPLDGYNFLVTVLPQKMSSFLIQQRTTLMIILMVLLVTPLSRFVLNPIYNFFAGFFIRLFSFF